MTTTTMDPGRHREREWLVTNGLGGYASGTIDGTFTRRYHGLLVAALPIGRTLMLNGLTERLRLPDRSVYHLGPRELSSVAVDQTLLVDDFKLEDGLPIWTYRVGAFVLERRLVLSYRQNTTHLVYRVREGTGSVRLGVRPGVHFRSYDAPVSAPLGDSYALTLVDDRCEISLDSDAPVLRLRFQGPNSAFTFDRKTTGEIRYELEEERGYEFLGKVWSPGYFRADVSVDHDATFAASTEKWETILAMSSQEAFETERRRRHTVRGVGGGAAQTTLGAELTLAADQFLITPAGRVKDAALAHAEGEEAWTVIAGYHWFTDWGRDTMISLEGLSLVTGRTKEARWILRTFANYMRDGLIPNFFPDGKNQGLYHTADATLWYFHALARYIKYTDDRETLRILLPKLLDIVAHHMEGTRFGIHVDTADGLLAQGAEGYQLTWMDAKVEDWVVTPRRGKPVEINGLWYNALSLLADWLAEEGDSRHTDLRENAARVKDSFNRRFWSEQHGHLYDVIDGPEGDDPACRPNQLFAFSLDHPVLARDKWAAVLAVVETELLTPFGLRSLSPRHRDYKARYFGDLRARDAAYHQGTVWAWLIGPFIDAWLKVHPNEKDQARNFLNGFSSHVNEACVGSINEIFDADPPFSPRGCVAQAWSVAEVLRCWVLTQKAPD